MSNLVFTKMVYGNTIKSPSGSFEKLEVEAMVTGNPDHAFIEMRNFVQEKLDYPASTPADEVKDVIGGGKVLRKDGKIVTAIDNKEVADEQESKEEAPKGNKGTKKAKAKAEEPKEEEKEEPKEEVKKPKKGKAISYDRDDESLKGRFSNLLHEKYPGWNKDDAMKKAAKDASVAMAGKDFLDADGEVLESFIEELGTLMESDL